MKPTGALLCSHEQHQLSTRTKYIHPISVQIPFKITSPLCLYFSSSLSFRFPNQSPICISTWDFDQLKQSTNLQCDTATFLQLFEHMKHERVRYWNLKHVDGLHVFFLQQFALHKIVLLTFESIWHPMKQLLSGLHIKIPGYTGMSTLPPYHNLAQHTIFMLHNSWYVSSSNTGHFFFVKLFISSSDIWILTFGEQYYTSMQKKCKF